MGADYVLHASLTQGRHRNIEFAETHFNQFFTSGTEGNGNWVIGEGHGGWIYTGSKTPRREYALEVGTAYSRPALTKIAKASLKDRLALGRARHDEPATGRLDPVLRLRPGRRHGGPLQGDHPQPECHVTVGRGW